MAILINVAMFLTFALAAFFIVSSVNRHGMDKALDEAEQKAHMLMVRNLATHSYFSDELKPSVFSAIKGKLPDSYFDPRWMSSTYAIKGIDKRFREDDDFKNFYYKEAAINARTPANEADEVEREFINRLNRDPALNLESGVRKLDGKPFFVIMQRGEVMQEGCLRCHSTPENAPADLIKQYGPERAFGRKPGMVISALSIKIPMEDAFRRAEQISSDLKRVLLITLGVLLFFQVAMINWLKRANDSLKHEVRERVTAEERLAQALKDKGVLLKEMNHRVKNNLSVVLSLIRLQSRDIMDSKARGYMLESENRIKAMTLIHERLYQAEDHRELDASEYIRTLAGEAFHSYKVSVNRVRLTLNLDRHTTLGVDTLIPIGLIVNEIISNSLKYAFADDRSGEINISLKKKQTGFELKIFDNGIGMPEGFDIHTSQSLGMQIITSLVTQIQGSLELTSDKGTAYTITFREDFLEEE